MADAIEGAGLGRVELIRGSGGVFDVRAGGRLVFSKARTGRFPDAPEVIEGLRKG